MFIFKPISGLKKYLITIDDTDISLDILQMRQQIPLKDSTQYEQITLEGFSVYLELSLKDSPAIETLREDLSQVMIS